MLIHHDSKRAHPIRRSPIEKAPSSTQNDSKTDKEDQAFVFLSGATPVIGAGMNLAYGGMVAGLSQSKKMGALALLGTAANIASLPLLGHGHYLGAIAAMAISGATMSHIHNHGWNAG